MQLTMRVNKIILQGNDGSVHYIDGEKDIANVLLSLPKKLMWKHSSNVGRLRNKYFLMISELSKACNTGYSKADLHESLKPILLGKLRDFKHAFRDGVFTNTTTDTLTYEGWQMLLEQLKVVANDIFNYTFNESKAF
jgi:hypothetical protein